MMLPVRSRWCCLLVVVLAVSLAISTGVAPSDARAQSIPDFPNDFTPIDDAQQVVDEARNIVAAAKECIAQADEAQERATSASVGRVDAETNRDDALMRGDEAEKLAAKVGEQRKAAETAQMNAMTAAEAAETALDELKKAIKSAEERADTEDEQRDVALGIAPSDEPRTLTNEEIKQALDDAKEYAEMATSAAKAAGEAAVAAKEAAKAAQAAAEAAKKAGEKAERAVDMARADAGASAAVAEMAQMHAQTAAKALGDARDAFENTPSKDKDMKKYLDMVSAKANEAAEYAGAAQKSVSNAIGLVGKVVTEGMEAGNSANFAVEAAGRALDAAMAARTLASEADACAREVSAREAALGTARAASAYLSRTITSRIQKLRPAGGSSFQGPVRLAQGGTGLNAGDVAPPDYPRNLAVDVGYSNSRGGDNLYKARSVYGLVMTDMLLTAQRLVGFGVGKEYTRESLLGNSVRRTRGLTATVYGGEILNEAVTLVPQVAVTSLKKETIATSTVEGKVEGNKGTAIRTLCSLTLLAQKQWADMEMSGFGQFAYTYETALGSVGGDATYLGQAIAGGEFALPVTTNMRLFLGGSVDYDVTRSKSTSGRFGLEGNLGVRSPLGSQAEFSLSATASQKDGEATTGGNVFVKFFF